VQSESVPSCSTELDEYPSIPTQKAAYCEPMLLQVAVGCTHVPRASVNLLADCTAYPDQFVLVTVSFFERPSPCNGFTCGLVSGPTLIAPCPLDADAVPDAASITAPTTAHAPKR
jgi:hypothetical protein